MIVVLVTETEKGGGRTSVKRESEKLNSGVWGASQGHLSAAVHK